MNRMIPIVVTGMTKDAIQENRSSLFNDEQFRKTRTMNGWFPFFMAIDNHENLTGQEVSEFSVPFIKPERKLSKDDLDIFKIKFAFGLFPRIKYAVFMDFNSETSSHWLEILISMMEEYEKEAIVVGSVFNDEPGGKYDLEPFSFEVPMTSITKDFFCMSRRLYNYMVRHGVFDIWKIDDKEMIARKTSMSLIRKDGVLCDRFI